MKKYTEKIKKMFGLAYYGKHGLLKVTTYLLLCGAIYLVFYTYNTQSPFFSKYLSWVLLIILIMIPIKEFLAFNANIDLGRTKEELEKKYKKKTIEKLLSFLILFYRCKNGIRATLFVPTIDTNGRQTITPYARVDIGAGFKELVEEKTCFFRKGEGFPGIAWSKAADIDNIDMLLERIQVDHIPEDALKNEESLKAYYKKAYSMNNEIYDSLGSLKNKIRSYLSVGFLTDQSRLGGVISIDSVNTDEFIDFESLKKHSKQPLGTVQRQVMKVYKGPAEQQKDFPIKAIFSDLDLDILPDIAKEIKDLPDDADTDIINSTKQKMMVAAFGSSVKQRYALDAAKVLYPLLIVIREIERTLREK